MKTVYKDKGSNIVVTAISDSISIPGSCVVEITQYTELSDQEPLSYVQTVNMSEHNYHRRLRARLKAEYIKGDPISYSSPVHSLPARFAEKVDGFVYVCYFEGGDDPIFQRCPSITFHGTYPSALYLNPDALISGATDLDDPRDNPVNPVIRGRLFEFGSIIGYVNNVPIVDRTSTEEVDTPYFTLPYKMVKNIIDRGDIPSLKELVEVQMKYRPRNYERGIVHAYEDLFYYTDKRFSYVKSKLTSKHFRTRPYVSVNQRDKRVSIHTTPFEKPMKFREAPVLLPTATSELGSLLL